MAPQQKRAAEKSDDEVVKKLKEKIKGEEEDKEAASGEQKDTQVDNKSEEQIQTNNNTHSTNNKSAEIQKNGNSKGGDVESSNGDTATAKVAPTEEEPVDKKEAKKDEVVKSVEGPTKSETTKPVSEEKPSTKQENESQTKEAEQEEETESEAIEGTLLICGGANWDMTGRKELPKTAKKPAQVDPAARNLWGPHRAIYNGQPLRVRGVFSGCNACHSVIITDKGETMTFGRNDKGQLGLGDTQTRITPTVVEALRGIDIVAAACGRAHTLFLSSDGIVFSCGDNKMGQCGTNQQAVQQITTPTRIAFKENKRIVKVACGAEFCMIVDELGRLYSFGHPEHGQLGHNSEGKYFTTGNKYAFHCEHQPRRIIAFVEKSREGHVSPVEGEVKIVDVACGTNHTLAVDTKHRCFAWGFAGYHRLGHQDTKNEMVPRSIRLFDVPPSTGRGAVRVFAGASFSMAIDQNGLLYFWGQNKSSGEATMYPKNVQDLCGWKIRAVGCANRSIFVAAEDSCISWGPSPTYGELGYGEGKSKSSTTPSEVRTLDGVYAIDVACGFGHTLIIARDQKPEEKARIEKNFKDWP